MKKMKNGVNTIYRILNNLCMFKLIIIDDLELPFLTSG